MNDNSNIPTSSYWRRWYTIVIAVLVLLVIFFAWFTNHFA